MEKPIISFKDVTFKYHSQSEPTLFDLNVEIFPGEKVLVIGASGSGKSTFGHCLNGLIPNIYKGELTGEVLINGKNILNQSLFDLSFDVGTVLQDTDGQFIGMTVGEDIAFSLENDAVNQKEMHKIVAKWMDAVDLSGFGKHKPQDLSGGQKQRVSMAGVLVDESPILLFDEPLANLDPKSGLEAIDMIDNIHSLTNNTTIIIEHRVEDVLYRPVDRVICFNEGRIVANMTTNELLHSDVLEKQVIREPLYVTALKYAKVPLEDVADLSSVVDLDKQVVAPYLKKWSKEQKKTDRQEKQDLLLSLSDLNYTYHQQAAPVLNDVNLNIYQGEMISLVGKNGAGKSTLAKAICGFVLAEGKMTWKGENFQTLSIKERADKVGFVMQNPNQMISKKLIREEVSLGLVLRGVPEEQINQRVDDVLKICGLYPFRNWPISALSYGQKKRVTIAVILVLEPEMIILDEPTAGQDLKHYTEMMAFLEALNKNGTTIVMITHDMHLMLEYTNRSVVLHDGKIFKDTTPTKLLTSSDEADKASLKETSLYTLAKQMDLEHPDIFVEQFTMYDREVRGV